MLLLLPGEKDVAVVVVFRVVNAKRCMIVMMMILLLLLLLMIASGLFAPLNLSLSAQSPLRAFLKKRVEVGGVEHP